MRELDKNGKGRLPPSVRRLVVALCADYERRRAAIESHVINLRVENEYKYYNYKILDAAAESVGEKYAEDFIKSIGEGRGYWTSDVKEFCESTFNYKKRLVIENIAQRLYLV